MQDVWEWAGELLGEVGLPGSSEGDGYRNPGLTRGDGSHSPDLRVVTYKCLFFSSCLPPPDAPHSSGLWDTTGLGPRGPGFCHVAASTLPPS